MSIVKFRFENCRVNMDGTNMKSVQFKTAPGITAYSLRNALAVMLGELPVTFLQPKSGNMNAMRNTPAGGVTQWWVKNELIRLHTMLYDMAKSARIVYDADYSRLNRYKEVISAQRCGEQKEQCYGKVGPSDIQFNGKTYENTDHNYPFTYSAMRDLFYPVWEEFEYVAVSVCKKDLRSMTGWDVLTAMAQEYQNGNVSVCTLQYHMEESSESLIRKFSEILKSGKISETGSIIRNKVDVLFQQYSFAPRTPAECTVRMSGDIYIDVNEEHYQRFVNGCGYSTLDLGVITLLEGESGDNSKFDSIEETHGIPPVETPEIIVG